jgi:hypothetical protein
MSNNSTNPPQPKTLQALSLVGKLILAFLKSKAFWRFVAISLLITFFALFGLGMACYFIVFGFLMTLLQLSTIYHPDAQLVRVMSGLPKGKYLFEPISVPLWKKILVACPTIIWMGYACFGMWLLFRTGFLAQNLIYILFFK